MTGPEYDNTPPPPALRARVKRTLRSRGLIAGTRSRVARTAIAVAAGAVIAAGGFAVGQRASRDGTVAAVRDQRPRFLLLLYEDTALSPTENAARVREYSVWADSIARLGHMEAGEELSARETMLAAGVDSTVRHPSRTADGYWVGGYFVIRAQDRDAALKVARSCPHLRHGGRVAVREIGASRAPLALGPRPLAPQVTTVLPLSVYD